MVALPARDTARRIICGFLPFLWSKQRIIYLDRELAIGQTQTFTLVLRSIIVNWSHPESSPAYPLIVDLSSRIDKVVEAYVKENLSKYARALLAISKNGTQQNELSCLRQALYAAIKRLSKQSPLAAADCAAYILGLLLEKSQTLVFSNESLREVANELQEIFDSFYENMEDWFMPYLKDGFTNIGSSHQSIRDIW